MFVSWLLWAQLLADAAADAGAGAPGAGNGPGNGGGPPGDPTKPPPPGGLMQFLIPMLAIMLLGFWLLRPRTNRQQQDALAKLKAGDKVVTSAGFFGTVAKITKEGESEIVTLRFEDGSRVQVLKWAITQVIPDPTAAPKDKDASAGK